MLLWIIRLSLALLCLVVFLIRGTRGWGFGLLSVSALLLLDALNSRGLLADTGFLGYAIGGALAAGIFLWLTDLARPSQSAETISSFRYATPASNVPAVGGESSAFDRQLIFEQIRDNLGPDDVLDIIFDLDLKENEIVNPGQSMPSLIMALLDQAESSNQMPQVALSVERILTPLPLDHLPRAERLSAETPSALLRQFMIHTYSQPQLAELAASVGVDWSELGSDAKKSRVRRLLLHLKRRGLVASLLDQINPPSAV